jgi:hypothetical protein
MLRQWWCGLWHRHPEMWTYEYRTYTEWFCMRCGYWRQDWRLW